MSRRAEAGFTLLEVLVALAIAGLGLGALFAAASGALGNIDLASRHQAATRHAQSHLAAVGIETPLAPSDRSGDDGDGFRWRVLIVPVETARLGPDAQAAT